MVATFKADKVMEIYRSCSAKLMENLSSNFRPDFFFFCSV